MAGTQAINFPIDQQSLPIVPGHAGFICEGERKELGGEKDHLMGIQHCFRRCGRLYVQHTYVTLFSLQPGAGNLKVSTPMQRHSLQLGWKLRTSAHKADPQADTLWCNWRVNILS